jgi:peptide/nickel transport system permease protein
MAAFLIRRIAYGLLVIFGVTVVTFCLFWIVPGDPASLLVGVHTDRATIDNIKSELGLDKPLLEQYLSYTGNMLKGDLGRSFVQRNKVTDIIASRLPATLLLGLAAMLIAVIGGIWLGIVSGSKANTVTDYTAMIFALLGISIPVYVLGLLLAWFFGFILGIFPISGRGFGFWSVIYHLILPAAALSTRPMALIARLTRSSMLEVLNEEYIRAAYARGLSSRLVIYKHALKNALNPVVTAISGSLAGLLSGAFFIEFIFNYPGIGLLAIDAIGTRDLPVIQGTVLVAAILFVLINIFTDIIYVFIDPRARLQ